MKHILTALLCLMTLASCEKPISLDSASDDKKAVKQDGNLIVTVANAGLPTTRLNFVVFDMNGSRIKQVNQTSGMADLGVAVFQLEPGTYQLVVVAHSSDGNPTLANIRKVQYTNAQGFTDTFLATGSVTIDDVQTTKSVSLQRISSLCRFMLHDDIPANVKKIRFYYTGGSGAFDATTGLGCVKSKQSVLFDVADGQKLFDLYTFLHAASGTISLLVTAYDANDNVLQERTYEVPLQQNHITYCDCPYFSGDSMASSITLFDGWEGEYHLGF